MRGFFLILLVFMSNSVLGLDVLFREFQAHDGFWATYGYGKSSGKVQILSKENSYLFYSKKVYYLNDNGDVYKKDIQSGRYTKLYSKNTFGKIMDRFFSNDPFYIFNEFSGVMALSGFKNSNNYLYVISIDNPKDPVFFDSKKFPYYPMIISENSLFYTDQKMIFELVRFKEKKFLVGAPCNLSAFKMSIDRNMFTFACSKSENNNRLFVYNKSTKIIETICEKCPFVDHDLKSDGKTVLYLDQKGENFFIKEYDVFGLQHREILKSNKPLAEPVYLD